MMATLIAETLLRIAYYLADPFTPRGNNLRWTVQQYFRRFRFMPAQSAVELHPQPEQEGK